MKRVRSDAGYVLVCVVVSWRGLVCVVVLEVAQSGTLATAVELPSNRVNLCYCQVVLVALDKAATQPASCKSERHTLPGLATAWYDIQQYSAVLLCTVIHLARILKRHVLNSPATSD